MIGALICLMNKPLILISGARDIMVDPLQQVKLQVHWVKVNTIATIRAQSSDPATLKQIATKFYFKTVKFLYMTV